MAQQLDSRKSATLPSAEPLAPIRKIQNKIFKNELIVITL